MKQIKLYFTVLLFFISSICPVYTAPKHLLLNTFNNIPQGIASAFKTGNSKALAKFFNTNIELVILDNEDVYSKQQAELIVQSFFNKHRPKSFKVISQGGNTKSKYAIANLRTSRGTFRVYFLIKIHKKEPYIHQLTIEAEEND